MSTRTYKVFNRDETTVTGNTVAPGLQLALATYEAQEDETVVSIFVQVALGLEMNTSAVTTGQLAGLVRIKILRAGQQANVLVPSADWDDPGSTVANSINDDRDVGETWAMAPYSIGSGYQGAASHVEIMLAPQTKRKLRRGDQIIVDWHYSNSAASNAICAWAVTGHLLTLA